VTGAHDIGKTDIPDLILLKPVPLDCEEGQLMEIHVQKGMEIWREQGSLDHGRGHHGAGPTGGRRTVRYPLCGGSEVAAVKRRQDAAV